MKKIILVLGVAAMITSCGGGCDTSSAEGAADCWCGYMDEMVVAIGDKDADALKDIEERMEKSKEEIDGHIEAGDYSEDELEAKLGERNCM